MPATFTVNLVSDPPSLADHCTDDFCSLRGAIEDADATAEADIINFNITHGDPIIHLIGTLQIFSAMMIDASTQPRFAGSPVVVLDGSVAGPSTNAVEIFGNDVTFRGFVIQNFSGTGIAVYGDDNRIRGNFIGTDVSGTTAAPNRANGIVVIGANNTIGGQTPQDRNVISGTPDRDVPALAIYGAGAHGNQVQGNYIGTDATGTRVLANAGTGVAIIDAADNTIGGDQGTTPGGECTGECNVISGNTRADCRGAIQIDGTTATNNRVLGNYVGVDKDGTHTLANGNGIIVNADKNIIGAPGAGNIIAGNLQDGVRIDGDDNKIQANYIGTNQLPAHDNLGNGYYGVYVTGSRNIIGAPVSGDGFDDTELGNWIAFNGQQDERRGDGVAVVGNDSIRNTIRLNHIFKNERLGIDLGDNYFDRYSQPANPPSGPNNRQWHPTIIGVDQAAGRITWMLNGRPSSQYTIDVYFDPRNGFSEYAEGEIQAADPIVLPSDEHGHLEFTTPLGHVEKITATATDADGNTSEFSLADADADGLCDTWETQTGIDVDGDGHAELSLPGANVHHKDVYVEVDAMTGFQPLNGVLAAVEDIFARVPANLAQNPDGQPGVTLHANLSTLGIPAEDAYSGTANSGLWAANYWQAFHDIKAQFFGPHGTQGTPTGQAYLLAYRYCVFARTRSQRNNQPAPGVFPYFSSGESEGLQSNDFMVTLGSTGVSPVPPPPNHQAAGFLDHYPAVNWAQLQEGTFMHELGHTLGLSHIGPTMWGEVRGGDDPGYLSVMSYRHQFPGVPGGFHLDYSRSPPVDWATPVANGRGIWYGFQETRFGGSGSDVPPPETPEETQPTILPAYDVNLFTTAQTPLDGGTPVSDVAVTFTVGNAGLTAATASAFAVVLPTGVTLVSLSTDKGTATLVGNTVSASFGDIGPGEAATVTLVLSATPSGSYDLTGQVVTTATDATPDNNTATVTVSLVPRFDFGDAPDSYHTLLTSNGAQHVIVPGVFLGAHLDSESDGQPNAMATGDDIHPASGPNDEDGVVFLAPLAQGQLASVRVTASVAGLLNAWMDFDANGNWTGPGEQIFVDRALSAGVNTVTFTVPAGATVGTTLSRWRFSTVGGLSFDGPATDGEVEDYQVPIGTAPAEPTISQIDDQTTNEDTPAGPISFTIGDAQTPADALTLIADSSPPGLVANIALGGSGADRTAKITPAPDQWGQATITITVTDGDGFTASDTFTLTVTAVNDPPSVFLANTTVTLAETTSTASRLKVADIVVTDDGLGANTLGLSGEDAAMFEISGRQLYLKAGATLDFETNPVLDVTVTVDDVTVGETPDDAASLAITVTNVNEAPTGIGLSANTVAENADGASVGLVTVTDPDAGDTHTLAVSDGRFEIVGGQLKLKAGQSVDFETEPTVSVDITATDAGGLSLVKPFVIQVTNVNEATWHNAGNPFDVSGTQGVTAQDVLLLVNYINAHPGDSSLPAAPAVPPPYYDVSGDGQCTANDVLQVINYINSHPGLGGEGESIRFPDPAAIRYAVPPEDRPIVVAALASALPADGRDDSPNAATSAAMKEHWTMPRGVNGSRMPQPRDLRENLCFTRQGDCDAGVLALDESLLALDEILLDIAAEISRGWAAG